MPKKSNTNFKAEQPRQGWAFFEQTNQWRRTPYPWGAPKDHFPKELGDWVAMSRPKGWQPLAGTLAGESLLGGGASLNAVGGGSGGGATSGTKIGAGHKPQPYGWHGYYGETGGGGKPGTDNEAWRLKEKQYTPEKLVKNARAEIGSKRWHPAEPDGRQENKCNTFVADKLHESGAPVPNVGGRAGTLGAEASDRLHDMTDGRIGGQPPSANDWHKGNVPGYERVRTEDGATPQPGDIAASAEHVGIVSGEGKTISVTTAWFDAPDFGRVVENDWGFRNGQEGHVTFWRYRGSGQRN